jgi:hypothetical protein
MIQKEAFFTVPNDLRRCSASRCNNILRYPSRILVFMAQLMGSEPMAPFWRQAALQLHASQDVDPSGLDGKLGQKS